MGYTAFQEFIYLYKRYGMPHLRPGQFFVGRYIKSTWPELFYERDENKAFKTIKEWLVQHQYEKELPQAVYKVEDQN
jgi:hypothetical protein